MFSVEIIVRHGKMVYNVVPDTAHQTRTQDLTQCLMLLFIHEHLFGLNGLHTSIQVGFPILMTRIYSTKQLNDKAKLFLKGNKGNFGDHPFTDHVTWTKIHKLTYSVPKSKTCLFKGGLV